MERVADPFYLSAQSGADLALAPALEPEDLAYLKPHLEIVRLQNRQAICETGDTIRHAYFPHDMVILLVAVMQNGRFAEMSLYGPENVCL